MHISDPFYYDTLYASSASREKRDKWEWSAKALGIPGSVISVIGHEEHKAKRAVLNRLFSMASVRKLQPVVEEKVRLLIERIRGYKDVDEKALKVNWLFSAYTNGGSLTFFFFEISRESIFQTSEVECSLLMNSQEVVMEYSCGRSKNLLRADDFGSEFHDAFLEVGRLAPYLKHMYWVFLSIQRLPEWLTVFLSPSLGLVFQMRQVWPP